MKNTIQLSLTIFYCCIIPYISIAQQYSSLKQKISKTWYVTNAIDEKTSGEFKNMTQQAKGTEFIFKSDHSFELKMKSRKREKTGNWKFVAKDSVRIQLDNKPIVFYLNYFSEDSMQLIGKENSFKIMHISLSSHYVAPITKSTSDEVEKNNIENITDQIKKSSDSKNKEAVAKQIINSWKLNKAYIYSNEKKENFDETESLVFKFEKGNTVKIYESGEFSVSGEYKINDNKTLNLTIQEIPINFEILSISKEMLVITGINKGVSMEMHFISNVE